MVTYPGLHQIMVGCAHPLLNEDDPDLDDPRKLIVRDFDGLMAAVV